MPGARFSVAFIANGVVKGVAPENNTIGFAVPASIITLRVSSSVARLRLKLMSSLLLLQI